ncbi:MAG: threonine synthase, partial [Oscillibacter sp.]|nr:threonine synthase [Oscillibacter sp.]
MKYLSTRDKKIRLSAAEAIKMGLSRDGGLLTPETVPVIDEAFLRSLIPAPYPVRAAKVMALYLDD